MTRAQLKMKAKDSLAGHWGVAILVSVVASILIGNSGSVNVNFNSAANIAEPVSKQLPPGLSAIILAVAAFLVSIGMVFSIFHWVLGGIISMGKAKYFLDLIEQREPGFSDLFSQFNRFIDALIMNILRNIFITLWTMLLVIPGIIATISYSMAPYILLEDPKCSGLQAITRSKEMMRGHKAEFFLLQLSFIGWSILCVFTFGIGFLWLTPYISATEAAFYENLKAPRSYTEVEF